MLAEAEDHQPGQEKNNLGTSTTSKIKLATEVMKFLTETAKFVFSLLHGGS